MRHAACGRWHVAEGSRWQTGKDQWAWCKMAAVCSRHVLPVPQQEELRHFAAVPRQLEL